MGNTTMATEPGQFETESLSEAVVRAVADAEGVDEIDLDPLFTVCDPDALDGLFQNDATGQIQFVYHGYAVTVSASGRVRLQKR